MPHVDGIRIKDLKISRTVVLLVAVLMVNDFTALQASPNNGFSYKAMLLNVSVTGCRWMVRTQNKAIAMPPEVKA